MAWYKLDEEGNIEGLFRPLAPAINYVARLNGTDQYWQLSEAIVLPENTDFRVEFDCRDLSGGYMLANSNTASTITGRFVVIGIDTYGYIDERGSATLDVDSFYVERVDGVISSNMTTATNNLSSEIQIDRLLGRFGGQTSIPASAGVVFNVNVYIGNVLTNTIPLTNKAQGATQLATVGNVNATMVNYDESVWEQV